MIDKLHVRISHKGQSSSAITTKSRGEKDIWNTGSINLSCRASFNADPREHGLAAQLFTSVCFVFLLRSGWELQETLCSQLQELPTIQASIDISFTRRTQGVLTGCDLLVVGSILKSFDRSAVIITIWTILIVRLGSCCCSCDYSTAD